MKQLVWDKSTLEKQTYVVAPRNEEMNVFSSRWGFRVKNAISAHGAKYFKQRDGTVTRGFQQQDGVEYEETFAPIVKFATLRKFLAIVATENLELHWMVVKTAFLHGSLSEKIFMEQPERYKNAKSSVPVCRLPKALYDFKQSAGNGLRKWTSINGVLGSKLVHMNLAFRKAN